MYLATTMDKMRQVKEGIAQLIPPTRARTRRGRKLTVHIGEPRGRKVVREDMSHIAKNLD